MFYAIDHTHDRDTNDLGEIYESTGTLHVFKCKQQRDKWVRASCLHGGPAAAHRETLRGSCKRVRHFRENRSSYRDGQGYYVTHAGEEVTHWHRGRPGADATTYAA